VPLNGNKKFNPKKSNMKKLLIICLAFLSFGAMAQSAVGKFIPKYTYSGKGGEKTTMTWNEVVAGNGIIAPLAGGTTVSSFTISFAIKGTMADYVCNGNTVSAAARDAIKLAHKDGSFQNKIVISKVNVIEGGAAKVYPNMEITVN
jgi:hypothetical protein